MLTCHTMDSQIHSIGKAIRPLFVDPVTYIMLFRFLRHFLLIYLIDDVISSGKFVFTFTYKANPVKIYL